MLEPPTLPRTAAQLGQRELRLRRRIDQLLAVRAAKERRIVHLEAELRRTQLELSRQRAAA